MSRIHLFCLLVPVLTGVSLSYSDIVANETDNACRGPKGEKVDSGEDQVSDFVKRNVEDRYNVVVFYDRVTMAIREYAD